MKRRAVTAALAVVLAACGTPPPTPPPGPEPGHTRLTSGSVTEDPFAFGSNILVSTRPDGSRYRLGSLMPGGPAIRTLLTGEGDLRFPALSPELSRIAWAGNARGGWDIYAMPMMALGTGKPELLVDSDDDETGPTWAPDGKRLAFSAFDRRAGSWRLRLRTPEGAIRDLGDGFAPAWHPSADRIVCQRARPDGGPWSIAIVDVASGVSTDVWPDAKRGGITPAWSSDGEWILFAARTEGADGAAACDGLWAVTQDGARRVRLTAAGPETFSPRETEDRRIVYCRREGSTVELWSFASPLPR
ncbi:MAG: PD40 domain-containing protein [Planctomycetia bacterium]|nr:PD40 domain-containing protein [Planctomycetia bacterium]